MYDFRSHKTFYKQWIEGDTKKNFQVIFSVHTFNYVCFSFWSTLDRYFVLTVVKQLQKEGK